ncbi:MAG: cytochrome P450 [Actinobacteria bacterium]|nr:MAG: cytochrome P450 [Actinomycetota bacterium]
MTNAPQFNIDPEQFWKDPYPDLAAMRSTAPVVFVPQLGATLITTRDAISACEKNIQVFSSDQPGGLMNVLMGQNMMRRDGAEHQAERKVYYPAVSPKLVREFWAAEFAAHAVRILDHLEPSGKADLVAAYAMPLSGEALKSMTGLTNTSYEDMDAWSQAMIDGISNYAGDPSVESRCHVATESIDSAIDEMLPSVRTSPDHSLLSVMLESGLPLENVRANIKLTISGGQNEPRDAIAGCVWALLVHPDQLALVFNGEVTWGQAFEEYCRWVSPIGMSPRRVAKNHEYEGVTFEENDRVFLMYGSANRDDAHFEDPDRFDVTRNTKKSLAFGAGPHFCAGAAASRSLVGDIALPLVFDRLEGLRLDESTASAEFGGWAFRGPLNLPVIWR